MQLSDFIDPKLLRILRVLLNGKGEYFHLHKLSSEAKVPLATTFRIVHKLVAQRYIEVSRIGKFKIYRLAANEKTKGMRIP